MSAISSILKMRLMPKNEFCSKYDVPEEVYDNLQKSKIGWIEISRLSDGAGARGITVAFGKGLSCRVDNISNWYITTPIKEINYENGTFETKNSTYRFKFKEFDNRQIGELYDEIESEETE